MAEEFAKEGAHVALCARGAQRLGQTAEALHVHETRVLPIAGDVTQSDDIERIVGRRILLHARSWRRS